MADIAWLRQHGIGRVAALLIHQMAAAPKSRDADLMVSVTWHHPAYAEAMGTLATADTAALVDILRDPDADLVLRAIAAMYTAGTRNSAGPMYGAGPGVTASGRYSSTWVRPHLWSPRPRSTTAGPAIRWRYGHRCSIWSAERATSQTSTARSARRGWHPALCPL